MVYLRVWWRVLRLSIGILRDYRWVVGTSVGICNELRCRILVGIIGRVVLNWEGLRRSVLHRRVGALARGHRIPMSLRGIQVLSVLNFILLNSILLNFVLLGVVFKLSWE